MPDFSKPKYGGMQLFYKTIRFLVVLPFYLIFMPQKLFNKNADLRDL
tara:strand:- start:6448 stop:6588 length:141 start_codon:yes stop_codon:yes gene_type:complete